MDVGPESGPDAPRQTGPRGAIFPQVPLFEKAGALLHSIARNPALVDGNKRTAWAATWLFLGYNGIPLRGGFDVDSAEALMNDTATGARDVASIAAALVTFVA
ncbi:type II toxin-antitoxin system death-on-curing family toxin [Rhodococcus sp. SJ-3]|uniref:type II toxin-antitoxin system death-on-curing family toxin n=1 Tax=Rhodococcus sp. SJ-3 TaxID=3454628 RepID=UPI003F7A5FFC